MKHAKHVTIKGDTDNQGGGHIGYFTSTINGKEGALFVHLNFGLFPEIPKVTKLEVLIKIFMSSIIATHFRVSYSGSVAKLEKYS